MWLLRIGWMVHLKQPAYEDLVLCWQLTIAIKNLAFCWCRVVAPMAIFFCRDSDQIVDSYAEGNGHPAQHLNVCSDFRFSHPATVL